METIFISMIGLEERVLGVFRAGGIPADKYLLFINREFTEDKRVIDYKKEITEKHLIGANYKILESSYKDPFIIVKDPFIIVRELNPTTSLIAFNTIYCVSNLN